VINSLEVRAHGFRESRGLLLREPATHEETNAALPDSWVVESTLVNKLGDDLGLELEGFIQ